MTWAPDLGFAAGMLRLEACKALGWNQIPVYTVNILKLKKRGAP